MAPACRQAGSDSPLTKNKMWSVYALQSLKDGKLYIGISENITARLEMHNSGMTTSTKSRRPFIVIYEEKCDSRASARKKEKFFKSGCGREFIKKFKQFIPE